MIKCRARGNRARYFVRKDGCVFKQKKITIAAIVIVLIALGSYLLYSQPFKSSPQHNSKDSNVADAGKIGVIDMMAAMQAHPQYQTLLKLRKERNTLGLEAKNTVDLDMKLEEPSLDKTAVEDETKQQQNQAAAAKLKEINLALQQKQREIIQLNTPEYDARMKAIDDQYLPDIFNLQLKLDTLALTKEVAQQIQQQIIEKKQAQAQQMHLVDQEFRQKVATLMQAEQEKARVQMDQYMAEQNKNVAMQSQAKIAAVKERNNLAAIEKKNELQIGMKNTAVNQNSLADKEQEVAALEDKIIQDISAKVTKIAVQEKLSAVLTAVQVNVNALDITEQVRAAFKND